MTDSRPPNEVPLPSLPGSLARGLLGFAVRMVVGFLLLIVFVDIIQTHHKYWQESSWKLPYITEQLVWYSNRVTRHWWPVLIFLVPPLDLAVTVLLAWRFRAHRWLLSAWAQFWLLVAVFILFWAIMTVTLPVTGNLPSPTAAP